MKYGERFDGPNIGRFVAVVRGNCFWPLKPRETIIEFQLFPIEEENGFGMVLSSMYDNTWFGRKITKDSKSVLMDIDKGFSLIWPLDDHKTKILAIFTIDPHLEYVPKFLINFGTIYIIPSLIDYGLQVLRNTPKAVADKIEANYEKYKDIEAIGNRFIEIVKGNLKEEDKCATQKTE